eukprot:67424-Pyramimonas_sp.AAC.1
MIHAPAVVSWKGSGLCGRNSYVDSRFGRILDRQDAAVRLTRSVEIQRTLLWHASGSSNSCLLARQLPQWK